jgi:hypothetical protein
MLIRPGAQTSFPSSGARCAEVSRGDDAQVLLTILTRAQELLAEPARWTRGALARSFTHTSVLPASELAWSWSAAGGFARALQEVLGPYAPQCDRYRVFDLGIQLIWNSLPDDHPRTARLALDIDGFNDFPGTHHDDVVELFERVVLDARSAIRLSAPGQSVDLK